MLLIICYVDGDQEPATKPPAEKAPKKPATKATEKKGKHGEVQKEEPLDPVAEKLRQQRWELMFNSCYSCYYLLFLNIEVLSVPDIEGDVKL